MEALEEQEIIGEHDTGSPSRPHFILKTTRATEGACSVGTDPTVTRTQIHTERKTTERKLRQAIEVPDDDKPNQDCKMHKGELQVPAPGQADAHCRKNQNPSGVNAVPFLAGLAAT